MPITSNTLMPHDVFNNLKVLTYWVCNSCGSSKSWRLASLCKNDFFVVFSPKNVMNVENIKYAKRDKDIKELGVAFNLIIIS
jgi:hypothetical protein